MHKLTYRSGKATTRSNITLMVAAGMTLAATMAGVTAHPGIAGASSVASSPAAGTHRAHPPLKATLLNASDLPARYRSAIEPIDVWLDIPKENFGEWCPAGSPPARTIAGSRTHVASAAFTTSGIGAMSLSEQLVVTGARYARSNVAKTAAAPRVCPASDMIGMTGTHLTVSLVPMDVPRLGDVSAGLRYVIRPRNPNMVVYGANIVVAVRDVFVNVAMSGPNKPDRRELTRIVMTAAAKVSRARNR